MKRRILTVLLLVIALTLSFSACDMFKEKTVTSISVVEGTINTTVKVGESLDTTGVKVLVTYSDGSTAEVGASELTFSNVDTSAAGTQDLTVTYEGVSVSVVITVEEEAVPQAPVITGIKIVSGTVATTVKLGDTLDVSKLQVEAIYSDGSKKPVAASEINVTVPDTSVAGAAELVVTYAGFTDKITVTVNGAKAISVISGTVASELFVGATLNTSNLQAVVTLNDGTNVIVDAADLTIGTIDTSTVGDKKLSITYLGFTYEYTVKVIGVVGIKVNAGSVATSVKVFGTLDTSKITAKAVFSNGIERPLAAAELTVENIDTTTAGEKTLVVKYGDFTDEVTVNVVGVKSIAVASGTLANEVLLDAALDLTKIRATVEFTDGTSDVIEAADLTLGSFSTDVAGEKELSITYLDKTVKFGIKVCGVASIRVENAPLSFVAGIKPSFDGIKVYAVYSDTNKTEVLLTTGYSTNIDSIDINTEGDKTVTVTYRGELGVYSTNVIISTTPPVLTGVEFDKITNVFMVGEAVDLASLVSVKVVYSNGATAIKNATADGVTLSALSTATAGNFDVTATYTEGGITKTVTETVKVLPVASFTVSGMPTIINKGETLNISNVKLNVTYSDGTDTLSAIVSDGFTVSAIDNTVGGDKTVTVAFGGKTADLTVHVKAVTGISFLAGAFNEPVRNKYTVSTANVNVEITYTDGTKEIKSAVELGAALTFAGLTVDVAPDVYTATVTATYEGFSATATVNVLQIDSITALNGTVPASVPLNSILPFEKIRLTAIFKDAAGNLYTFLISNSDTLLEIPAFDTTTVGEKAIVFNYFGLSTSLHIIVKGIDALSIVDGTLQTTINKGQEVETAEIKVMVHYTDGSYVYVDTTDMYLSISHNVNNQVEGDYTLTVTYQGVTLNVTIKVKDVTSGGSNTIFGTSLPSSLTARESYKNNFKVKDEIYVVGDDNPYIFRLTLLVLDENFNLVDTTAGYTSVSQVYLVADGTETLVGEEYVGINEANNSFDFTDAAVGKTFKIVSAPADAPTMTQSHTVKVVDAYNIYSAKELNIVNNTDRDLDEEFGEGYLSKLNATNIFLAENNIARPTNLRGIVLHGNIDIKMSDIPKENFYTYTQDGVTKTELFDQNALFCWSLTPENPTFDLYGNYYNLYSYNIPCVVANGIMNNVDQFSQSEVFMFRTAYEVAYQESFTNDGYATNVYNLAMRDNDPNSNDQSASDRHMRGLIGFKPMMINFNVYNTNVDAYYISVVTDSDYTYLNLDRVKFYNAWQGHIFIWNSNSSADWRGQLDQPPVACHQSTKVNITDSLVAKCGGPVILSQTEDAEYLGSANSKADVVIDDKSEVYSYVTGQEAWFVAVGQTAMAGQIMAMNALVSGTAASCGATAGYTSTAKIQGVSTMNLIMVIMGSGLTIGGGDDYDGSCTIGGTSVLQMNDGMNPLLEGYITATNALGGAPVFQSSEGGVAYGNPYGSTPGCYQIDFSTGASHFATGNVFQGDYISLYYQGLGVLLEYYH